MNKFTLQLFVILLFMAHPFLLSAQYNNPVINNIEIDNGSIVNLFKQIEKESKLTFSYNTKLVNTDSIVSYEASNITIQKIINELFFGRLESKIIGEHIVLIPNWKKSKKKKSHQISFLLKGNIYDARNSTALANVSIYDVSTSKTTLSDSSGYYELLLDTQSEIRSIVYAKNYYKDSIATFELGKVTQANLYLLPLKLNFQAESKKIDNFSLGKKNTFFKNIINKKSLITSQNLYFVYEKRPVQISFLPFLGSNAKSSGIIENSFSLNILGGYNGGVNGVEIGSLFNVINRNVYGMQAAGLFNIVGENVYGVQISGIFNTTRSQIKGAQISSIINWTSDTLKGAQIAGIMNYSKMKTNGVQVSSIINKTNELKGVQISLINISKINKGFKIGLINVSDSSRGVAIGLFNWVNKGYHAVELSANEVFYANLILKLGARHFYTLYSASISTNKNNVAAAGFGFGSNIKLKKKFSITLDLSTSYVYEDSQQNEDWVINFLTRFKSTADYQIGTFFMLGLGPAISMQSSQLKDETGLIFISDIAKDPFYSEVIDNTNYQFWWGIEVFGRFFF